MKKNYIQPAMFAVMLQHSSQILTGSLTGVSSDTGTNLNSVIGNASEDDDGDGGRVKGNSDSWCDEW